MQQGRLALLSNSTLIQEIFLYVSLCLCVENGELLPINPLWQKVD